MPAPAPIKDGTGKRLAKSAAQQVRKAHTRDSLQALSKLAERVDGQYRIVSQPPIVVTLPRARGEARHVGRRGRSV